MTRNYFSSTIVNEVTLLLCYDQRIQVTAISSVFHCLCYLLVQVVNQIMQVLSFIVTVFAKLKKLLLFSLIVI